MQISRNALTHVLGIGSNGENGHIDFGTQSNTTLQSLSVSGYPAWTNFSLKKLQIRLVTQCYI